MRRRTFLIGLIGLLSIPLPFSEREPTEVIVGWDLARYDPRNIVVLVNGKVVSRLWPDCCGRYGSTMARY